MLFGYAARSQQQLIINLSYLIYHSYTLLCAAIDFEFPFVLCSSLSIESEHSCLNLYFVRLAHLPSA